MSPLWIIYGLLQQQRAIQSIYKLPQIYRAIHTHTHACSLFFIYCRPKVQELQSPGVSRPLQLLTATKDPSVVSKQVAAAKPEIRGRMFDVTSTVEVTARLRPHTAGAQVIKTRILTASMSRCFWTCKENRTHTDRGLTSSMILDTQHAFLWLDKTRTNPNTQSQAEHVSPVQSEAFQLRLLITTTTMFGGEIKAAEWLKPVL